MTVTLRKLSIVRPVTFRIRPERKSRLSLQVEIYPTVGAMRRIVRAEGKRDNKPSRTRGLVGMCQGVTERRRGRRTGLFAIVRIPKQYLQMSTITHEAFHATCRWVERRGHRAIPVDHSDGPSNLVPRRGWVKLSSLEERAATVHDEICRRLVIECRRRQLVEG